MKLLRKLQSAFKRLFSQYVLKDRFYLEVARWFKDKGDVTLRLSYPLTPESIVFDLGGYHGDFAAEIYTKYGSKVYVFEPVPEFYKICLARFKGNPNVMCFKYGLSASNDYLNIGLAENASSFASPHAQGDTLQVEVRSIVECIEELSLSKIDLMKINIEGGEFDVIPAIIQSGDIKKVANLQVQFHNFIDNAVQKREEIRSQLIDTHTEAWSYEFVWESWKLRS